MFYWIYKYRLLILTLIVVAFFWYSGLFSIFLNDYKCTPEYRGFYAENFVEAEEFKCEWINYIIENDYKWNGMLWIPSGNQEKEIKSLADVRGFLEISWYEKKDYWWEIR